MIIGIVWLAGLLAVAQPDNRWLVLSKEAYNLQLHDRFREAADVYNAALQAAEKLGPGELPVATILTNLGYNRQQLGDIRQATRLYAQALAIFERKLPAGDPRLFEVVMNLSNAYFASDDISHAEALLRRFSQNTDSMLPEQRAALMEDLGTLEVSRGNLAKAHEIYQKSLDVFLAHGEDKERIVIALANLSVVSARSGDLPRALGYNERARSVLASLQNPSPVMEIKTWLSAAALIARMGRPEEAARIFEKVISMSQASLGPDHYLLGFVLDSYAHCLLQMHRKKEARQVEKRAKSILDRFRVENGIGATIDAKTLMNAPSIR